MWRLLISSFSFTDIISESSHARGGGLTSRPARCEMQLQSKVSPRSQHSHPPAAALGLCWRISGCWEAKGFPGMGMGMWMRSWSNWAPLGTALAPASLFAVEVSLCRGSFPAPPAWNLGWDEPPNSRCSHPLRAPLGRAGPGAAGGWKPPGGEATSREEAPSPRAGLQGEEAG